MAAAPKMAASWDALAALLSIDTRRLYRLRLEHGAPATRDVEAWRVFVAARAATGAGVEKQRSPAELEREQADLRYARARAEREERANALEAGQVVTKDQARAAAALVREAFIGQGQLLPGAVVAQLSTLGKSEREQVEAAVRAAWQAACTRIAAGPAHAG